MAIANLKTQNTTSPARGAVDVHNDHAAFASHGFNALHGLFFLMGDEYQR